MFNRHFSIQLTSVKMEPKYALKIVLLLSFIPGYSCINVNFCSGETITDEFGSSSLEYALKLNGSYSAVSPFSRLYERTSCICDVRPTSETPEKLTIKLRYLEGSTDLKTCYKSVTVKSSGGHAVHEFGCASDTIEVGADDGVQLVLNLYGNSGLADKRVVDESYILYVLPDPSAVLHVRCHPPVSVTSSTSKSSSSSTSTSTASSTSTSPSSTRAFVKTGSIDTSIVVGIVIGLGLFFLVFISCMLCFIARRKTRRDDPEKPKPSDLKPEPSRNVVGRTLTNFRNKIKSDRPLPRIPASIRKIALWKSSNSTPSGVYDSVKSDRNKARYQLDKQVSQGSECSYMEPVTIATISRDVARDRQGRPREKSDTSSEPNILHDATRHLQPTVGMQHTEQTDSSEASYIHPISKTDSLDDSGNHHNRSIPKYAYADGLPAHVYVNHKETKTATGLSDTNDQNTEPLEEDYMAMSQYVDMDVKLGNTGDREKEMKETNDKDEDNIEESLGYVAMDVSDISKPKGLLKKEDSTFPDLIEFVPHERVSKDSGVCDLNLNKDDINNQLSEKANVKTKRYVKERM